MQMMTGRGRSQTHGFGTPGGLVTKSCPTLCDPIDCSPPGSSVHGLLQVRILECIAISSSRGSSALQAESLLTEPPGKPLRCLGTLKHRLCGILFHVSGGFLRRGRQ